MARLSPTARRALKMAAGFALLGALYTAADWGEVAGTLGRLDAVWLVAGLALFVPQTLVSALRWRAWIRPLCRISVGESVREILASSALNLVLPSKLGDLSKSAMLPGPVARKRAAGRAVVEKGSDVAALAGLLAAAWIGCEAVVPALVVLLFAAGIACSSRRSSGGLRPLGGQALVLAGGSLTLWCLHLLQLHCFLHAAGVGVGVSETLARVPPALFAGLLPVSWCGLGTRDAALVYLFADVAPASTMAVVGLLTALRYVVPGAAGIPFVGRYLPGGREGTSAAASVELAPSHQGAAA